ncbi:UNVERIFIED_CONTAM: hypothetical protein FKN15_032070 [Acipenser sinensis]
MFSLPEGEEPVQPSLPEREEPLPPSQPEGEEPLPPLPPEGEQHPVAFATWRRGAGAASVTTTRRTRTGCWQSSAAPVYAAERHMGKATRPQWPQRRLTPAPPIVLAPSQGEVELLLPPSWPVAPIPSSPPEGPLPPSPPKGQLPPSPPEDLLLQSPPAGLLLLSPGVTESSASPGVTASPSWQQGILWLEPHKGELLAMKKGGLRRPPPP